MPSLVVARASGALVWDVDGREYLDFAGGLGCQNLGHNAARGRRRDPRAGGRVPAPVLHGRDVRAVRRGVPAAERALALPRRDAAARVLFNSGAEAVENAVKIARAATGRPAVVVFDNAFHGRTLLTMTMTSKVVPYKRGFGPFAPEVYRAPAPYPFRGVSDGRRDRRARSGCSRARSIPTSVACVVLEPVQGEGGFVPMTPDFPRRLQELLRRARDPLRRRRGPGRLRPHRPGVGDRALRRRARPARRRQVARRRAAARGGHRPRRA